jgi:hypothetical protein
MPDQEPNSIMDLKKFLSTPERPVSTQEMSEFWKSCTEEEKEEFKRTPLK